MAYRHGVYVSEVPTSIVPPVRVSAGLPVFIGTAPVNQTDVTNVNKPVLCYSYAEAVQAFGFSKDFENFTLCEAIYSQFALYNVAPVVLINVLDVAEHSTAIIDETKTFVNDKLTLEKNGAITSTVVVKNTENAAIFVLGTDYITSFNDEGYLVVTRLSTGTIAENGGVKISYSYLDTTKVTDNDVIGGVDVNGDYSGLELINSIFPKFRLVPGQILAPIVSYFALE
jgi:phage tail sheath protein FI